jgi:uncharacterized protein (TIGR03083 family)
VETAPQPLIAALRHSHERLASLVHAVSEDFLTSRSYCADWTVAQVLSHLGSGAEISQMMLESTLSGEPMDRDAFPAVWDRWNGKTPVQQAADCLPADEAQISRLEGLSQAELDGISLDFFGMKLDAAGVVRLRLSEHAMHTWDVAAAIDPVAVVAPDAAALLTGQASWLAERTGRPGDQPFQVRLRGTNPDVDLLLDVTDKVTLTPWPADSAADGAATGGLAASAPGGEILMPGEAVLRLLYGRLDPAHTPPADVRPGPALLDQVRAVFPGF